MDLLGIFLGTAIGNAGPDLSYKDGVFRISGAGNPAVVRPFAPHSTKVTLYHSGDQWVVWDERGLTLRSGKSSTSTWMEDFSVTPKLFERDQILANAALIKTGVRSKRASCIIGQELRGAELFLIARWEDRSHKPWLDALIKIDLQGGLSKPILVGKFSGLAPNSERPTDWLSIDDSGLVCLVMSENSWGISTFDLSRQAASFRELGTGLINCVLSEGGRVALVTERTAYGTTMVARVDLKSGARRNLTEARGKVTVISQSPIVVRIDDSQGTSLRTTDTGAEMRLQKGLGIASTEQGMLLWAPEETPVRASLFSPKSWTALATWKLESPMIIAVQQPKRNDQPLASRNRAVAKSAKKTTKSVRKPSNLHRRPKPPVKRASRPRR